MKWRGLLEICPPGTHECDPVWRTSVCRFHDVKLLRLSSSWTVQVGLNYHGKCLYERRKRRDAGGWGGGTEKGRRPQEDGQSPWPCSFKTGARRTAGRTAGWGDTERTLFRIQMAPCCRHPDLGPGVSRTTHPRSPYNMNTACIKVFILFPPPPGRQVPFRAGAAHFRDACKTIDTISVCTSPSSPKPTDLKIRTADLGEEKCRASSNTLSKKLVIKTLVPHP